MSTPTIIDIPHYKEVDVRPQAIASDYIWVKENSLSRYFCNKVIEKFDEEPGKWEGLVGENRVDKSIKHTEDFNITNKENWEKEDAVFFEALNEGIQEYMVHLESIHHRNIPQFLDNLKDSGYKLQRYEPDGFYDWHNDWVLDRNLGSRIFVYMWYLNTIKKKDGGYTEFSDGTRLQPKCGSLVIFPATWTYLHRGYPPKVRKYLCNGWIYSNL